MKSLVIAAACMIASLIFRFLKSPSLVSIYLYKVGGGNAWVAPVNLVLSWLLFAVAIFGLLYGITTLIIRSTR